MQKKIAVVCNPTLFNSKALQAADVMVKVLKKEGVEYLLFTTYWPTVWEGITDVWIVGGDGTVNYFINQYPQLSLPLSVFKGGSGNDLHKLLYGDISIEKQVHKVLSCGHQAVDAGTCNGKLFLNGVGIGFDGAVVNDLVDKDKMTGKVSYILSILKQIVNYTEKDYEIVFSDAAIHRNCFMINVANGKSFGGGFCVAPKASPVDGLLDINIVGKIDGLKRIKYLPLIEKGEHLELPFIQYEQKASVIIKTPQNVPAHLDGELMDASTFDIQVLPKKFLFAF